jgi:hypothetical protein
MGRYWSSNTNKKHKRAVFAGRVVETGLSGLESYCLFDRELHQIDSKIYRNLRSLEQGRATLREGGHFKSIWLRTLFRRWRFLPTAGELSLRRVKWLQQILRFPRANRQLRSAIWGHLPGEEPTIDEEGQLHAEANPFAKQLSKDLWLYHGLSPCEEFFFKWERFGYPWQSLLEKMSCRCSLQC